MAVLLLPVLFNLVLYWPILRGAESFSDLQIHIPAVDWARNQILTGHIPLDGWFPNFSLGASQFHRSQSFPAIISGFLAVVLGGKLTVLLTLYLLWSFWPVCIYWTARLFDRNRGEAFTAAVLTPLIAVAFNTPVLTGYGFDVISYISSGLWTQLWAAWFLPPALALAWRALQGRVSLVWPALLLAGCICSDILIGYFALLLLIPVFFSTTRQFGKRLLRLFAIGTGAMVMSAWLLVPIISDFAYIPHTIGLNSGVAAQSVGLPQALQWLFTGQLLDGTPLTQVFQPLRDALPFPQQFDPGQIPVISVLAALGTVLAAISWKKDAGARTILLCGLVSVICYAGPKTFGFLDWFPGGSSVLFHRFVGPLQLFAIYLAGTGGFWAWTRFIDLVRKLIQSGAASQAAAASAALLLLLSPSLARTNYAASVANLDDLQILADNSYVKSNFDSLLQMAKNHGPGRIFGAVHLSDFEIGSIPVYLMLAYAEVDQVGDALGVQSLAADAEFDFDYITDKSRTGAYHAFNIRYLLLPDSVKIRPPATLLADAPPFALYEINGASETYTTIVDTVPPPVTGVNNGNIGDKANPILDGTDIQNGLYHTAQYDNLPAPAPSWTGGGTPAGTPGHVTSESADLAQGEVTAAFNASRPATALLSASYDNRWTATVDGQTVNTQFIAPALVGVAVPAGTHTVEFRYAPYPYYWFWIALGLIAAFLLRTRRLNAWWQ